jgi:hypothetical protein
MDLQSLVHEIEDGRVRAFLRLASTTYNLLERLEEDPQILEARNLAADDASAARQFLRRAETLFERRVGAGYVHPDDLALAAYLFIFARVPRPTIQAFVDRVAEEDRREFFRATPVAKYLASLIPSVTAQSMVCARRVFGLVERRIGRRQPRFEFPNTTVTGTAAIGEAAASQSLAA